MTSFGFNSVVLFVSWLTAEKKITAIGELTGNVYLHIKGSGGGVG